MFLALDIFTPGDSVGESNESGLLHSPCHSGRSSNKDQSRASISPSPSPQLHARCRQWVITTTPLDNQDPCPCTSHCRHIRQPTNSLLWFCQMVGGQEFIAFDFSPSSPATSQGSNPHKPPTCKPANRSVSFQRPPSPIIHGNTALSP